MKKYNFTCKSASNFFFLLNVNKEIMEDKIQFWDNACDVLSDKMSHLSVFLNPRKILSEITRLKEKGKFELKQYGTLSKRTNLEIQSLLDELANIILDAEEKEIISQVTAYLLYVCIRDFDETINYYFNG